MRPRARQWLSDELAKPIYQNSRPSWFDQLSKGFADWLGSLFGGTGASFDGALPVLIAVVATLVVAGIVIVSIVLFGVPRRNRRAASTAELFAQGDDRSASELRRASAAAADAGDWRVAIAERFRALARSLSDRTIVDVLPGTTADAVTRGAVDAFPESADALRDAARWFDSVRYADHPGSAEQYERMRLLDDRLASERPAALVGAPA